MDCSPPGSSIPGIFQARIMEWVAISFSKGSSQPRDRTHISCMAGKFFTTEPPGKTTTRYYQASHSGLFQNFLRFKRLFSDFFTRYTRKLCGHRKECQEPEERIETRHTDSPGPGCSLPRPGGCRPWRDCPWCPHRRTWCERHIHLAPWASTWHHTTRHSGRHTQSSPGRGLQWQTLGTGWEDPLVTRYLVWVITNPFLLPPWKPSASQKTEIC